MCHRVLTFSWLVLLVLICAGPASSEGKLSQRQTDLVVVQELRDSGTCISSTRVIVCSVRDAFSDPDLRAFLALAEDGAARIRNHLGAHLDLPGDASRKVEIFLSPDAGIPHVTIHQEPWIFIHPDLVRKRMAPYLHEMVHVMAQWSWRNSEWIAEGFANHVASVVAIDHAGYHRSFILPSGLDTLQELRTSEAGVMIRPLIGLPGRRHTYPEEPRALAELLRSKRRIYAPPYYAMSWSFVSYLANHIGYEGLRRVALSNSPSDTLKELTGNSMAEHLETWEASLAARQ